MTLCAVYSEQYFTFWGFYGYLDENTYSEQPGKQCR